MMLEHRRNYPAEWPLISEWTMRAAGNQCIRCGHPQGDFYQSAASLNLPDKAGGRKTLTHCTEWCTHPIDGKLRILTVHHLDGDKSNVYWWNLLALCQVCHLQIQAKVNPELPYLWEHSEWFKPYVAGFYAAYYAQSYLSRHEVEAMIEELLTLGQPWRSASPP